MILKSPELNVGAALICFGFLLAVPNLEIGLIGLDFTQYSSATHIFIRLGMFAFIANFLSNAINGGEQK